MSEPETTPHPLTTWRAEHDNMSMAALARRVGCSVSSILRVENGSIDPSASLTRKLVRETGLTADVLVNWTPPSERSRSAAA